MENTTNNDELEIKDDDKLFYHIPRNLFKAQGFDFSHIPPHAFTPQGDGNLSVNWEKFCPSASDCLKIPTPQYPDGRSSATHGVGHFITGKVRNYDFSESDELKEAILQVVYSPSQNNQAHAHISGIPPSKPKPPYNEMRVVLRGLFNFWDIEPD